MPPYALQLMQPQDLETVARLWARARRVAHPELEDRMRPTPDGDLRYLRDQVLPAHEIWLCIEDAAPIGFLSIRPGHIEQLYVDPPRHREGVGTLLLRKAQEISPERIHLFTHAANKTARVFYEYHGFVAIRFGTSPPPENEPDVEYEWTPRPASTL